MGNETEVLTQIPVDLDRDSLFRRCHIKAESEYARQFEVILEEAHHVARPKAVYREAFIDSKGEETVTIEGVTFVSRALRSNLEKVERVFPYVATCGIELDQIKLPGDDLLKQFWIDEIKATVLDSCRAYLNNYLDNRYALSKTASMSPGSGDVNVWPIEQQRELFSLFGDVNNLIGVELTDSYLMIPNKTVSGLRFPTEVNFRSCMLCHRENCPGRSAPFHKEMWDSIQRDSGVQSIKTV